MTTPRRPVCGSCRFPASPVRTGEIHRYRLLVDIANAPAGSLVDLCDDCHGIAPGPSITELADDETT